MSYSKMLAMPTKAAAYSYHPTVLTVSPDELVMFFGLTDDDDVWKANLYDDWTVVEVKTDHSWHELKFLLHYQQERLWSGNYGSFVAREWYHDYERADGAIVHELHTKEPFDND